MVMMGLKIALLLLAGGILAWSQTPGERELSRAQSNLDFLRSQVEAGVLPRAKLEEAQEALADAHDAELLSRTLYGRDLTEEQTAEMEAAALRRLERRKAEVEKLKQLVDADALARNSLTKPMEDVTWARQEYGSSNPLNPGHTWQPAHVNARGGCGNATDDGEMTHSSAPSISGNPSKSKPRKS